MSTLSFRHGWIRVFVWFACCAGILWTSHHAFASSPPAKLAYDILQTKSHDTDVFTQGLVVDGDFLVEMSGHYGRSFIRRYLAETGEIIAQKALPSRVFAEGLTQVNDDFIVLTWRTGIAFRLNAKTLATEQLHSYTGQGWGLTYDGTHLIMSDGSDHLTLRNANDFSISHRLKVVGGGEKWDQLNELEYAQGVIWANIWKDERIIAIQPATGEVLGTLDLSELVEENNHQPGHSVLNGIAYDPEQEAFWITGKLWPRRYLVRIRWPENEPAQTGGNRTDS